MVFKRMVTHAARGVMRPSLLHLGASLRVSSLKTAESAMRGRSTWYKKYEEMKAGKLLESLLYCNETEQQGIAVSGLFETQAEFVQRWFGECVINGGFKNNARYLYSYGCELSKFIPDMVLKLEETGEKVYLYEIED
mgnify:CR=1 FL=1